MGYKGVELRSVNSEYQYGIFVIWMGDKGRQKYVAWCSRTMCNVRPEV